MNTNYYNNDKLNPYWITGFTDAEGCFHVNIYKDTSGTKLKWRVQPSFQLNLHIKDLDLLKGIKSFFNTGNIYIKKNSVTYDIRDINSLVNIVIPHFNKYSLISQKYSDYILFRSIVELVENRNHLTKEGLERIVELKASLNKGLPPSLKIYFSVKKIVLRTEVVLPKKVDYNWLAGFFSGDGCFYVRISKTNNYGLNCSSALSISITQHSKDQLLMNRIMETLKCGNVFKHSLNAVVLRVSNFQHIIDIIIPLFKKYPIKGVKSLDFRDFCEISEIMQEKLHLSLEGLKRIKKIKEGMNKYR